MAPAATKNPSTPGVAPPATKNPSTLGMAPAGAPHPGERNATASTPSNSSDRDQTASTVTDSGDRDADASEEKASEDLAEMRALEQVAIHPESKAAAARASLLAHLGLASPLRARLMDQVSSTTLREDASPLDLPKVTDLASFDVSSVADQYDIPVEMQPLVADYIRFFQGPGRKWFEVWLTRAARYIPVMKPILERAGLPGDTVYLAMIESGFSTHARSWANAVGPWQFIASTGKHFGLREDFWVDERRDPIASTVAAARYLSQLHQRLGSWYLAWAAYNTGGHRIARVIARSGTDDFWKLAQGDGLAEETKEYVPKLIACALVAKHPRAFGFDPSKLRTLPPLAYDEVKLVDPTDLSVIAKDAGVTEQAIRDLNPELLRFCTPPASKSHPYVLRLPKESGAVFLAHYRRPPPSERLTYQIHHIRRGDTLSGIAHHFHSSAMAILQLNHLSNARRLRLGRTLVIPIPVRAHGKALSALIHRAKSHGVHLDPGKELPAGSHRAGGGVLAKERIHGKVRLSYDVGSGDTLWALSRKFDCSVSDLRRWNHLGHHAVLHLDALLYIWPGAKAAKRATRVVASRSHHRAGQGHATPRHHKLAAGETLWSVARRYGVSVRQLERWNAIKDAKSLQAGRTLRLVAP